MTMSPASPFEYQGKNASNPDEIQQQPDGSSLTDATNSLSLSPPTRTSEKKRRVSKLTKYHNELSNLHRSPSLKPQRVQNRRNIPAFLNKLFNMVDDQSTADLIRWSQNGDSFLVENHEEFAQTVLPRFFKHNIFSSFVRQLNMYDFHKVPVIQQGAMATDPNKEIWEFKHPNFQRGKQGLLASVIRKRNKDKEQPRNEQIDLSTLIGDLSSIKERQSEIMESLHMLRTDNEMIWNEALEMRKKYKKQRDITIKVLQFLSLQFRGYHNHLQSALLELQNSSEFQGREENVEDLSTLKNGLAIEPSATGNTGFKDSETTFTTTTENICQRNTTMTPMDIDQKLFFYSDMLDSASEAAHNINQNMDQLKSNVESLASQISLDFPGSDSNMPKDNLDFLKLSTKQVKPQQLDMTGNGNESILHSNNHPFMTRTCNDLYAPMTKVIADHPNVRPHINSNFVNLPLESASGVMTQLPNMFTGNPNAILDDTLQKDEHKYKKTTQNKLFFINYRPATVFYK